MRKDLLSQGFKRIKVKNTYGETIKTHPFLYKTDKYTFLSESSNMIYQPMTLTATNPLGGSINFLLPNTQYKLMFELTVQETNRDTELEKHLQHVDSVIFQTDKSSTATIYHKYFVLEITGVASGNPQIEFTAKYLNNAILKITGLYHVNITESTQKLKQDITPIISSAPTFSTQRMGWFYDSNKSAEINNVCKINNKYIVATADKIAANDILKNTGFSNSNWTVVRSSIETRSLLYNYHNDTVVAIYNCDKPETTRVIVSSDGIIWQEYAPGFKIWDIHDAKDNKGYFVSTTLTSVLEPTVYYTEDFITFKETDITIINGTINSVHFADGSFAYFNKTYYFGIYNTYTNETTVDVYHNDVLTSTDGITWSKTRCGIDTPLYPMIIAGKFQQNSSHLYCMMKAFTGYQAFTGAYNGNHRLSYMNSSGKWVVNTISTNINNFCYLYAFSKGVLTRSYKSDTENLITIYTHDSSDNLIESYQMTTPSPITITDIMELPSTNEYPAFLILSGSKVYVLEYSTEHSSSVLRTVLELQDTSHYNCGIQTVNGLYIINGYYSQDARTWVPVSDLFMSDGWEEDEDGVGTDIVLKALIKLTDKVMIPIKQGVCHGDLTLIHCDQALPGYSEVKTYDQL